MQTKTFLGILGGILLVIGGYMAIGSSSTSMQTAEVVNSNTPAQTPATAFNKYKDGTYAVTGNYESPAGPEQIGVSITLQDGVITDAVVTPEATRRNSVRFQGQFASGYKQYVIGKNINDVNLTQVSGSSLTPIGFNDAIAKVKAQAGV